MRNIFLVIVIILSASVDANSQKNSIQLAPYSIETSHVYSRSVIKPSMVFRFFYEKRIKNKFAVLAGYGYLHNDVTIPDACCDQNSGNYEQTQNELSLGLRYFLRKSHKKLVPYLEQNVFHMEGSVEGNYGGGGIAGSPTTHRYGRATTFGTRTRLGLEHNISKSFFISTNVGLAIGFGSITHKATWDQWGSNNSSFIQKNYGSNIILSEFRLGYRF